MPTAESTALKKPEATKKAEAPQSHGGVSRLLIVVVALVVVAAVGGAIAWYRHVEAERDRHTLTLEGNIDVRQVNLAFKVDGRIATLTVDEGDEVTAGQVLATLDHRYFDDDLRVTRAPP